jgi:hypothetical protein
MYSRRGVWADSSPAEEGGEKRDQRSGFRSQADSCCASFVDYNPLTLSNFAARTGALIVCGEYGRRGGKGCKGGVRIGMEVRRRGEGERWIRSRRGSRRADRGRGMSPEWNVQTQRVCNRRRTGAGGSGRAVAEALQAWRKRAARDASC